MGRSLTEAFHSLPLFSFNWATSSLALFQTWTVTSGKSSVSVTTVPSASFHTFKTFTETVGISGVLEMTIDQSLPF